MRRLWLATLGLGLSCTMINPAFEDGRIADEAAGSDEQVESSDSVAESGSGSADESTTGTDSTESSDVTETGPSESSTTDAESSTGATSTTDTTSTTETTDTTTDSESTDTGGLACAGLMPANECQICAVEACCTLANFDCFDPDKSEGCSCVLDCVSLGGLLDLCAVDCVALLAKALAGATYNCIQQNCDQVCP